MLGRTLAPPPPYTSLFMSFMVRKEPQNLEERSEPPTVLPPQQASCRGFSMPVLLTVGVVALALYAGLLTYQICTNRAASESVDKSLAESIFKQLSDKADQQD